jgi:hypothetical protein
VVWLLILAEVPVEYHKFFLATRFGTQAIGFSLLQSVVQIHVLRIPKFNFLAINTCRLPAYHIHSY